jgi:SAM-dependent methyltransferase
MGGGVVGLRKAYRRLRSGLHFAVDRLLHVRTHDDYVSCYLVSGWVGSWRTIRALKPRKDEVFLDVGSGTGRVVYVASRFPFRRVIGVERDEELHRVAEENLRNARWRGHAEVELVCADIAEYPIPDDVTVVYLYNPIYDDVLETFVARLIDSVDRSPRRLRIAYFNPQQEHRLLTGGRGRLRKIGRVRNTLRLQPEIARRYTTFLYEVVPTPE